MKKTPARTTFDLQEELKKALAWLWKYKAERRAEMEAKGDTKDRWYAEHTYTTATELERRVRAAAAEKIDGLPYGSKQLDDFAVNSAFRIGGLNGIPLLQHCRTFLFRQGLQKHNFGRGHCSGERFRAPGCDVPESEQKTLDDKAKVKPIHFHRPALAEHRSVHKPLCTASRPVNRHWTGRRSKPVSNVTSDPARVTCPRCRKLMDAAAASVAK